jgi:hypothetical protein
MRRLLSGEDSLPFLRLEAARTGDADPTDPAILLLAKATRSP